MARRKKKLRRGAAVARKPHKLEVGSSNLPVATPPTDFEEFQRAYGDEWLRTIQSPGFRAAMQLLNIRKLESITNLSNEQIEKNGREILSDLKGHLQHENDLLTLHEKRDFKTPFEEEEEYFPPEQIVEIEELKAKLREQQRRAQYGN